MKIGLMSALIEELGLLINEIKNPVITESGKRKYYEGELWGIPTVLVYSRVGKVAAAATAANLILQFGVTEIFFTGVAGGIAHGLNIGDVVVGSELWQHDMDASPLFPRHEIPLLGKTCLETDGERSLLLKTAAENFIYHHLKESIGPEDLARFGIVAPKVVLAEIASGDLFFSKSEDARILKNRLPTIACVEMEGAAVAQVCYEYEVPFVIVRTISDSADDHASIDFGKFIEKVSNIYSYKIVMLFYEKRCAMGNDSL